jgi:acetyltransferase-like isoleucine patch superfamily enzyme
MNLSDIATLVAERLRHHLGEDCQAPRFSGCGLQLQTQNVPDWWTENGNVLYTAGGDLQINLEPHPGLPPPTNAAVVIGPGGVLPSQILLWGDQPMVIIERGCQLPAGSLNCAGGSTIILGENTACTFAPTLNARNGGLISVAEGGLWSSKVTIFTDDMHAILDAETGKRVNAFGGCVRIERHVWLGFEVMVLQGAKIGPDTIVGARAVVNGALPGNSVCVGAPARAVRYGVTWNAADIRPGEEPPLA